MDVKEIAQQVRDRLKKYDDFQGLYLYGSQIKGTARPDSDIDIILIFNNQLNYKQQLDLAGLICDIEYKYDVFIDYHPFTLEELNVNAVFSAEVITKGVYYEAA